MSSALPLLLLLPLLPAVLAGVAAPNPALEGVCYSEQTCRGVCKYGNLLLRESCERCYPDICRTEARSALNDPTPPPEDSEGRLVTAAPPTPSPGYVPPVGCIDQNGLPRAPLDTWADDDVYPCVLYTCPKEGGEYTVDDLSVHCVPEPVAFGDCSASRNPGQCCYNYTCYDEADTTQQSCLDADGNLRRPDEVWNDDDTFTCVTYICANGVTTQVTDLRVFCKPPPAPHCEPYREAPDCCFSYNCNVTTSQTLCRDAGGSYRRHGDVWYDDVQNPCLKFRCHNGETQIDYDLTSTCPAPQPNCRAFRPAGACCYNYTCGCVYRGNTVDPGSEFVDDEEHPCRLLRCQEDGVVVTVAPLAVCRPLTCQNQLWPVGECCRRCPPCSFGGIEYQEGETFYDDSARPCRHYRCQSGQPVLEADESLSCPPAPDAGCTPWHMEGQCCPKWDCDEQPCMIDGVKHDHGTTWPEDPVRPCRHLICNNSAVLPYSEVSTCEAAPYPHCIQRDVPYQCCPDWDCVSAQCRYGSDPEQLYSENQKWYDDPSFPCKQFTCTKAGVVKTQDLTEDCPPLDPPDCRTERDLGQCCRRCVPQPPQCVDQAGGRHDPSDTYFDDPAAECVLVRCLHNTTVTIYDRRRNCGRDPRRTNPRCSQVDTVDCCPVYHCPACEYHGHIYQHGERWWDSEERRCTQYLCGHDGTNTTIDTRLPCPPVRAGCVPNHRGAECCHYKYTCMFTPQGTLIPMPPSGGRSFEFDGFN